MLHFLRYFIFYYLQISRFFISPRADVTMRAILRFDACLFSDAFALRHLRDAATMLRLRLLVITMILRADVTSLRHHVSICLPALRRAIATAIAAIFRYFSFIAFGCSAFALPLLFLYARLMPMSRYHSFTLASSFMLLLYTLFTLSRSFISIYFSTIFFFILLFALFLFSHFLPSDTSLISEAAIVAS